MSRKSQPASKPTDPINDLNRQNLLALLGYIGDQLKRIADQGEPVIITRTKEPEFGKADYTDRDRRKQAEDLKTALGETS